MKVTNHKTEKSFGIKILKFLILIMTVSVIVTLTACIRADGPVQSVRVVLPSGAGSIAKRASEILGREITERCGAKVITTGNAKLTVKLVVKPGIGTEGYNIANGPNRSVRITGNDERGLLYGVGKFLHTSRYDQGGFTAGVWRGTSVPKGTIRGIYFATHFNNFYEAASDEERLCYIESLALWGTNALVVHFPNQWLQGFDDPKARESLRKLNLIMCDAKAVGMRVGVITGNFGFTSTPKELLATHSPRCWGTILCPSKPAAMKLMLKDWDKLIDKFAEPGLDQVVFWPYDEGGCNCKDCAPWGSRGYPKMCQEFTTVLRAKYPKAKVILSTWWFDAGGNDENGRITIALKKDGEYAGLSEYLAKDNSWVDYLMIDAHEEFPAYPLKVGVPGGLSMVNFPEISMVGQYPWGGFGANPLPQRFQYLWDQTQKKMSGGFPYSEGIYEDINKTVCSQLYWDPDRSTKETVQEYIAYEYSPNVVDSVSKAIELLEHNHMRKLVVEKNINSGSGFLFGVILGGSRIEFQNTNRLPLSQAERLQLEQTSGEAFRLIQQADAQLTPHARASWRWRILYLRAIIDKELVSTNGWLEGPTLKAAFEELTRIYHSENTSIAIHVPRIDDPDAKNAR